MSNKHFENIDIDLPKDLQIGVLDNHNLALLINFKRETNRLDYKETFLTTDKKHEQDFSKDISALANIGGGYLVVGVNDKKIPVGINTEVEKKLDPTRFSQIISKYLSPSLSLSTYIGTYSFNKKDLRIALLYISEFEKRPYIIKDTFTYYDSRKKCDVSNLYKGTIYVRKHSSSQLLDSDSWEELLERYYLKILQKRRNISQKEREDIFKLERKTFFDKMYSELNKK